MDNPRPRIRLIELWRIPAAIALVVCAVAARLVLGAAMPADLPGHDPTSMNRLAAAMIIGGMHGIGDQSGALAAHHGLAFDDRLLLDIAEAVSVLPPVGVPLPAAKIAAATDTAASTWSDASPPPPHDGQPDPHGTGKPA